MKKGNLVTLCIIFIIVALFLCGFLLGNLYYIPEISHQRETHILFSMQILSNVVIACIVSVLFVKYLDNHKFKRNVIIKQSEFLQSNVQGLSSHINDNKIALYIVNMTLKKIGMRFESFNKVLKMLDLEDKEFDEKFRKAHSDLKHLMTYTPVDPDDSKDPPIKCIENQITFNKIRRDEIEGKIMELEHILYELQCRVAVK